MSLGGEGGVPPSPPMVYGHSNTPLPPALEQIICWRLPLMLSVDHRAAAPPPPPQIR